MDNKVRTKLREIVASYGMSVCDDPRRCEALLRDFVPDYRREIFVLVNALKEGIGAELKQLCGSVASEALERRLWSEGPREEHHE